MDPGTFHKTLIISTTPFCRLVKCTPIIKDLAIFNCIKRKKKLRKPNEKFLSYVFYSSSSSQGALPFDDENLRNLLEKVSVYYLLVRVLTMILLFNPLTQ